MKPLFYLLIVLVCLKPYYGSAQSNVLVDQRDNQSYQIGVVNGQTWMLENLMLETVDSYGLSEEFQKQYPDIEGRWYHMHELSTVCPVGWRLPSEEDWMGYFQMLAQEAGVTLKYESWKSTIQINGIKDNIDLFEEANPLQLVPAGIYQGEEFLRGEEAADFWIQDMKTKKESDTNKEYKSVKVVYPGTSHIHLYNGYSQIHSHENHVDPEKPDEMRRFLVRCIYKEE